MKTQFVVGRSKKVITPPIGTPLYGYPDFENRKATSVHDDLSANVAVFGNGVPCAALISMDLCALRTDLTDKISGLVSKETSIPKENIIISAIHTHSGPCTTSTAGWGVSNDDYIENILIPNTLIAAKEAVENAQPALLGIGTTDSKVGINRRQISLDGKVILGQNPYGCYDPEMTVLSFVDFDKKPLLNIIHYGAHATAAGRNLEITRDWPGFMIDRVEAESGAMTFFINGAEGDVGPRLSNGSTTGTFAHAHEVGGLAAIDASRAYHTIKEYREVDFKIVKGVLSIPYCEFPSREEIVEEIKKLESSEIKGTSIIKYNTLKARLAVHDSGEEIQTHCKLNQVLFSFNSVVLVPFPFEMFSEITVRLRQYSPFRHTLGICNANGALAYLPSKEQLCRGGYEIQQFTGRHVYRMVDNTDDVIISENLKLIDKLI